MLITNYNKISHVDKLKSKFLKKNLSDFSTGYIHNH